MESGVTWNTHLNKKTIFPQKKNKNKKKNKKNKNKVK